MLLRESGRAEAPARGQDRREGGAGPAAGEAQGLSPSLPARGRGLREGQGKTDLEGRDLHTVTEADGA